MKYKSLFFLATTSLFLSCSSESNGINFSNELDSLKEENQMLRSKLDSLNDILNNETLELVAFNNSYYKELQVGDSAEFIIGLLYNRPFFCDSIMLSSFTELDSMSFAVNNFQNYDFNHKISLQSELEQTASTKIKLPYLSEKFFGIAGVITILTNRGKERIPFQHILTDKQPITPHKK